MRTFRLLLIIGIGILGLSSCLKDDTLEQKPFARMAQFNAFYDGSNLNYTIDGNLITTSQGGLPFSMGFIDDYKPGERKLVLKEAPSGSTLVDTLITLKDFHSYSTYVYGKKEKPTFLFLEDVPVENINGRSGIRFLQLADDIENVDFFIGEQKIDFLSDRHQETPSSAEIHKKFEATDSGIVLITIKDKEGNEITKIQNQTLDPRRHYTFILIGNGVNEDHPLSLEAFIY